MQIFKSIKYGFPPNSFERLRCCFKIFPRASRGMNAFIKEDDFVLKQRMSGAS